MQGERVPAKLWARYEEIVEIGCGAALQHLGTEFAEMVGTLTAVLARKRPSPLDSGRPATWAAAILFVLARTNFLYDKTQTPHTTPNQLAKACGVSASAANGKARAIEDLLGIVPMDPRWTPPSRLRDNPFVWLIEVDGLLVDARTLPREMQEKAVAAGAIPFLPDPT